MKYKIYKINTRKDFKRDKIYEKVDISNEVIAPFIDIARLDTTLDSTTIKLRNKDSKPITPFTRMIIEIENDVSVEKIYRIVYSDNVSLVNRGNLKYYEHNLELLEITKWLERFEVDNTTITNILQFLYTDNEIIRNIQDGSVTNDIHNYSTSGHILNTFVNLYIISQGNYANDSRFYTQYKLGEKIILNVERVIDIESIHRYGLNEVVGIVLKKVPMKMTLESTKIQTPSGEVDITGQTSYDLTALGNYTITQTYRVSDGSAYATSTYVYDFEVVAVDVEDVVKRYNIYDVITNILNKVALDGSIRRAKDSNVFQLDENIVNKLKRIPSPEFTFTQNTLFGILMEIGSYIHAIPRLLPNVYQTSGDDYSLWNIITFDFWGESPTGTLDVKIGEEYSQQGDNYTTAFVSNVQNAFQTNNIDYITMVEPFNGGFKSARTISEDFEISNNSACIKTSLPIQQIRHLYVMWGEKHITDIAPNVVESARYNIMATKLVLSNVTGYKGTNLYYTRGDNKIQGLTFISKEVGESAWTQRQAIYNILELRKDSSITESATNTKIKDLMFRVEYVPYVNFKIRQYKGNIDDNSGANTLFFNQSAQGVDIEAYGENMQGALMQTSNVEPNFTTIARNSNDIIKSGEVINKNYFAYQVNREFSPNRVKATIQFSKDWNKWNEYTAIKKVYREYEISERENVEQNPTYNEFCIISDKLDFTKIYDEVYARNEDGSINKEEDTAIKTQLISEYNNYLNSLDGFCGDDFLENIEQYWSNGSNYYKLINELKPISAIRCVAGLTNVESAKHKGFILPASCFSCGKSMIINFGANDNYSIGTQSVDMTDNYALEEYVEYGDNLGKVENMSIMLLNGGIPYGDSYIGQDFDSVDVPKDIAKTFSKELDSLNYINYINLEKDYQLLEHKRKAMFNRDNPLLIQKDTRQSLKMTMQLNFVSDNEKIYIGSALAQNLPFVRDVEIADDGYHIESDFKFGFVFGKPNRFLNEKIGLFQEKKLGANDLTILKNYNTQYGTINPKTIRISIGGGLSPLVANMNYTGVALLDKNNKIMIYYEKEIKKGETAPDIYLQFRRKI